MSELLGVPPIAPHWAGEWQDGVYLSARLARAAPAVRAVVTSHSAHLLIVGAAASGKKLIEFCFVSNKDYVSCELNDS